MLRTVLGRRSWWWPSPSTPPSRDLPLPLKMKPLESGWTQVLCDRSSLKDASDKILGATALHKFVISFSVGMELVSNKVQWKFQRRPNSPKIMFSNLGQIPSQNLCCLLCLLSQLFSNEHHVKPQSGVLADVHHLDCGLFTRSSDWLSHCYNSDWGRVKSKVWIEILIKFDRIFSGLGKWLFSDWSDWSTPSNIAGWLSFHFLVLEWRSPRILWLNQLI